MELRKRTPSRTTTGRGPPCRPLLVLLLLVLLLVLLHLLLLLVLLHLLSSLVLLLRRR
jgi:hypothetical protein